MFGGMTKVTRKTVYVSVLIGISLFASSCQSEVEMKKYNDNSTTVEYSKDESREILSSDKEMIDVVFEDIESYFEDERAISNIDKSEFYWIDQDINFDFYLTEDALKSDVQKVIDFFVSFSIAGKEEATGYGNRVAIFFDSHEFESRICRVFVGDQLIIKHRFVMDNWKIQEHEYFENNLIELKQRKASEKLSKGLIDLTRGIPYIKKLHIEDAFKPFTIFVNVDLEKLSTKSQETTIEEMMDSFGDDVVNEKIELLKNNEVMHLIITFNYKGQIITEKSCIIENDSTLIWDEHQW